MATPTASSSWKRFLAIFLGLIFSALSFSAGSAWRQSSRFGKEDKNYSGMKAHYFEIKFKVLEEKSAELESEVIYLKKKMSEMNANYNCRLEAIECCHEMHDDCPGSCKGAGENSMKCKKAHNIGNGSGNYKNKDAR